MEFRLFVETYETDIAKTLSKLPAGHRKLVKGYQFKFQPGNTLKGDSGHVGVIDDSKKQISIAAPWEHSRAFTLLHEIAHLVWKHFMTEELCAKWKKLASNIKVKDNDEEKFCMVYSNAYTKHKVETYSNKSCEKFIKSLPC